MKREFKDMLIFEPYENLNSEITGDYDKAHAVKCVNGTFVGTEENGVASWLGMKHFGVMRDEDTSVRYRSGHRYAACIL